MILYNSFQVQIYTEDPREEGYTVGSHVGEWGERKDIENRIINYGA